MPQLDRDNEEMPRELHFIWFGGPIPGQGAANNYRQRIAHMAAILEGYAVNVWLSPQYSFTPDVFQQNWQWCTNTENVTPREFTAPDQLQMLPIEVQAMQMQWDTPRANFGAMSDIARVIILARYGGMYIDTDCRMNNQPQPPEDPINLPYGFMATKRSWTGVSFTNSVLASVADGVFINAFRQAIAIRYQEVANMNAQQREVAIRSEFAIDDEAHAEERRQQIISKTLLLAGPERLNLVANQFTLENDIAMHDYAENVAHHEQVQDCVIPYQNMPNNPDNDDFNARLQRYGNMDLQWHNAWAPAAQGQGNAPAAANMDENGDPLEAADGAALNAAV